MHASVSSARNFSNVFCPSTSQTPPHPGCPFSLHLCHAHVVAPSNFRSSHTSSPLRYPFQIFSGHSFLLYPLNMSVPPQLSLPHKLYHASHAQIRPNLLISLPVSSCYSSNQSQHAHLACLQLAICSRIKSPCF